MFYLARLPEARTWYLWRQGAHARRWSESGWEHKRRGRACCLKRDQPAEAHQRTCATASGRAESTLSEGGIPRQADLKEDDAGEEQWAYPARLRKVDAQAVDPSHWELHVGLAGDGERGDRRGRDLWQARGRRGGSGLARQVPSHTLCQRLWSTRQHPALSVWHNNSSAFCGTKGQAEAEPRGGEADGAPRGNCHPRTHDSSDKKKTTEHYS